MKRSFAYALLAGAIGFISVTQAASKQVCRPALAIKEVQFSEWRLPSMERKWTAAVSVDTSRCVANSAGYFEIVFSRLKENGVEIEFREEFIWLEFGGSAPSVKVSVDFWADEAVEGYWLDTVTPCPCR